MLHKTVATRRLLVILGDAWAASAGVNFVIQDSFTIERDKVARPQHLRLNVTADELRHCIEGKVQVSTMETKDGWISTDLYTQRFGRWKGLASNRRRQLDRLY